MTVIWNSAATTPAATHRVPVDRSSSSSPAHWTGQQIADVRAYIGETVNSLGSINTNQSLSLADGRYIAATITGNVQFTFTSVPAGATEIFLELTDGGAHTVSFAASLTWTGGTVPSLPTSGVALLHLRTRDGGTTYLANMVSDEQSFDAAAVTSGVFAAARLPTPTTTALGGVKRNTGSAGQFVIGIDTDGSLLRDTPAVGSSTTKWIGAGELIPRVTNGAGIDGEELATNKINLDYLAFDTATAEYAQASFAWPGSFTTFTAQFHWTAASGSGTVTWTAAARCYADDDALDQALGTAQSVTDTLLAANDAHKSSATSAVTPGGTVASGNLCVVQIGRDIADSLGVDARLIGVHLEFA